MRRFIKAFLALVLLVSLTSPVTIRAIEEDENNYGTTYYLDSAINKSDGDGLSPDNAFDSLDDVNERIFQPGDKIFIKAGSEFAGTLWPKGSGCEGYPIIIDMYGQGAKPLIDGSGAYFMPQQKNWQGPFTGENGDQIGAAVYLYNQEYIEINNLAVRNQGDDQNRDRSGIRVEGYDYGVINHIYIRNCDVRDVRGYNGQDDVYSVIPTDEEGRPIFGYEEDGQNPNTTNTFWGARTTHRTGGINLSTYTARLPEAKNPHNVPVQELDESKKITIFNDVLIENNTIENCQANGITTTNVKGSLDDDAFRHTNVIIRGNYIHNVTRAGIIPLYTSGVLVEFNKVDTFQSTYEGYGCGIWCDRANDMVFQYNEVCNGQNGNDGMAFNLDDMTRNGLIQYNYTHDNYGGGYMLHVRQNSYNRDNVIRYNLSINDSGVFAAHNAQIVAVGENETTKIESAKVYNNSFISNKDCHAVYQGDEIFYNNNIWYFTNPAVSSRQNCFEPGANSSFNNNAYIGCNAPIDANKYLDNPQFVNNDNLFGLNKIEALKAASLLSTSPYLNAGIKIDHNGGKDIMGRPVGADSNLGAINGPGHMPSGQATSVTIKANDEQLKRYLSDGTLQTEIINESVVEANTKWVNTTFDGTPTSAPVIYTKKLDNYIEFSFNGTGGTMTLKHGAGAGKVVVKVYLKSAPETEIKTTSINTYSATPMLKDYSFADLSATNEEYIIRVYNNENAKATNFSSFVTNVNTSGTSEPGCANDQLAGVVLPQLLDLTIPYGKTTASVTLDAKAFMDTCSATTVVPEITYTVDNGGQIDGNTLIVNKAGTYQITAQATYDDFTVTDSKSITVNQGKEPQVNVPEINTQKLKVLINICNSLDLNNYFEENRAAFEAKLVAAVNLLLNNEATQAQIDTMVTELQAAKDALVKKHYNAEDADVIKTGNWTLITDTTLDQGSALKSGLADEKMSVTFSGNSITAYGRKAVGTGTTRFVVTSLVNGQETQIITEDVDCYQTTKEDQQVLFTWTGAENGNYRLDIINTGIKNPSATNRDCNTIIDFIKINRQGLNKQALEDLVTELKLLEPNKYVDNQAKETFINLLQEAELLLKNATSQTELDEMVIALNEAKDALILKSLTKVEAESDEVKKLGNAENWTNVSGDHISKTAIKTDLAGNKATYTFNGDGIEVIGRKAVGTGIIKFTVYKIDGEAETIVKEPQLVDTYQAETADGQILFAYYGNSGTYRVECENTGTYNDQSNGSNNMIIDYFNVVNKQQTDVNKTLLQIAVEEADKITAKELEDVVPIVIKEFMAALNEAKAILANNNANQGEVNDSFDRLAKAMHMLSFIKGDKTELTKLVVKIRGLNSEEYLPNTWNSMLTVLNVAEELLANENALKDDVNKTYDSLVRAFMNLRYKPNKDLLAELINKVKTLNKDDYTPESWSLIQISLTTAMSVYVSETASEAEVNNAKQALETAFNRLVAKETHVKDIVKQGDQIVGVKTGDNGAVGILALAMILSTGALCLLKRKEEN